MEHVVKYEPTFPMLQVNLAPNEVLVAEAGTMVARSTSLSMAVRLNANSRAGFFGKLKTLLVAFVRRLVGGETFFVNHFSSAQGGWVWLAPALSGSIMNVAISPGHSLMMTQGSFLASTGPIDLHVRWGGLRAVFAKEGGFFIEAAGQGQIWLTSYGAIDEIAVDGSFVVDNGHLVAFDASLDFQIKSPGGGLMGFVGSGEGLVCELHGRGRVYVQSRNTSALVGWLAQLLP
jgi:uncharacterized protein (TIGR00266 family)